VKPALYDCPVTYKVSRAVDEEQRVSDVVLVTGRILEHEDGIVGQIIFEDIRDGQHIPAFDGR